MESNTEKKPLANVQNRYKNETMRLSCKRDMYMGSNRKKKKIAIEIFEKLTIWYLVHHNYFLI